MDAVESAPKKQDDRVCDTRASKNMLSEQDQDREVVRKCLLLFFADKRDAIGELFCKEEILSETNVMLAAKLKMMRGIKLYYQLLGTWQMRGRISRQISPDIQMLIECLNECAKLGIPKKYAIGVVVAYVAAYLKKSSTIYTPRENMFSKVCEMSQRRCFL